MPRPMQDPLGAGESSSVPGTAAIANAIFDATGVRFREPPFTPEVVRAALNPLPAPEPATAPAPVTDKPAPAFAQPGWVARWGWSQWTGLAMAVFTAAAALVGWRAALPSIASSPRAFSAAQIDKGAQLAALGNCVSCHTADQCMPLAGGRPFETPYGTVYSTNLTPDPSSGIGLWSYEAFARAMREGVSRYGHALYPVFPYTAFARLSEDDMTALYAWVMSQTPRSQTTPEANMVGGLNLRPVLSVWNALFHHDRQDRFDSSQSAAWNRGEYLVNGVAHCGACHTPRHAGGAEQKGRAYLQGAWVHGWHEIGRAHV